MDKLQLGDYVRILWLGRSYWCAIYQYDDDGHIRARYRNDDEGECYGFQICRSDILEHIPSK